MGREFWDSGVEALAPETTSPAPALALLAQRDFVVEGRADGAPEVMSPTLSRVFSSVARPYSFTHALLRDSVYQATRSSAGPICTSGWRHARAVRGGRRARCLHLERAARLRAELRPQEERGARRARRRASRARGRACAGPKGRGRRSRAAPRALRLCSTTGPQHGSGSRRASRSQAGRPTRSSSSRATSSAATGCGRSPDVAGWVSSIGRRISPSGARSP